MNKMCGGPQGPFPPTHIINITFTLCSYYVPIVDCMRIVFTCYMHIIFRIIFTVLMGRLLLQSSPFPFVSLPSLPSLYGCDMADTELAQACGGS